MNANVYISLPRLYSAGSYLSILRIHPHACSTDIDTIQYNTISLQSSLWPPTEATPLSPNHTEYFQCVCVCVTVSWSDSLDMSGVHIWKGAYDHAFSSQLCIYYNPEKTLLLSSFAIISNTRTEMVEVVQLWSLNPIAPLLTVFHMKLKQLHVSYRWVWIHNISKNGCICPNHHLLNSQMYGIYSAMAEWLISQC